MTSKYDTYWERKLDRIGQLLEEAHKKGVSSKLKVSDIQKYGNRENWYGVVEISKNKIKKGEMAHAKSLGRVVLNNKILDPYKNKGFRFRIPEDLELTVEQLSIKNGPYAKDKKADIRKDHLSHILAQIPWNVWEHIVKWELMKPFLDYYGFGPFAVLMLTLGLNDYQLKGRAEEVYWPPIHRLLKNSSTPRSPKELFNILVRFYQKERFHVAKLRRLNRFLYSPLTKRLWESSSQEIAIEFSDIGKELAQTMKQKPSAKTICFAMKCLGISLLMAGEYGFDFSEIPIPVDSRVRRFSLKAKLCTKGTDEEIQAVWYEILCFLQRVHPKITMVHLDSLVWQIASLQEEELQRYFDNLGVSQIGMKLSRFIYRDSLQTNKIHSRKILILFPCSGRKINSEPDERSFEPDEEKRIVDLIGHTRGHLLSGRRKTSSCINKSSKLIPALDRYDGNLYRVSNFRKSIRTAYLKKNVHILIMSGAYGILTPSERIRHYDKEMDANYWIKCGLSKVIQEYVEKNKITHVYGFFSLSSDYMEIMRSIDWQKLRNSTVLEMARMYYIKFKGTGGAQVIVPQIIGMLIVSFIKSKFNQNNFYRNPFHGQRVKFIDHLVDSNS